MDEEIDQKVAIDHIAKLMDTQKYSDIIIECQGRQWKVHKAIVCSASDVLAAEFDNEMLEKGSGVIKHEEFDADTVGRMISYIYKQTYDVEGEFDVLADTVTDALADATKELPMDLQNNEGVLAAYARSLEDAAIERADGNVSDDNSDEIQVAAMSDTENQPSTPIDQQLPTMTANDVLAAHIEVFGIADYYCIDQLKVLATERCMAAAERSGMQIEGFVNVIKAVNGRTKPDDESLREALRHHALKYLNKLTSNHGFMTELAESEDIQDFAVEMLRDVVRLQKEVNWTYERRLAEKDKQLATLRGNAWNM